MIALRALRYGVCCITPVLDIPSDLNFSYAVQDTLKHEGGYTNNIHDKGGVTNFGISLRYLQSLGKVGDYNSDGLINDNDIKLIDKKRAVALYKDGFWDKYGYGRINNEALAEKMFDLSVNMGPVNAHKLLQKAINLMRFENLILEDGIFGQQTINAINISNPKNLLLCLKGVSAWYYIQIVDKNPSQKVFIKGWLKRATSGL